MRGPAAFLALSIAYASPAAAQSAPDPEQLANCMFEKTTDTQIKVMKNLFVAALQDDVPGMQANIVEFGSVLVSLAMTGCGLGLSQLQEPVFKQAAEKYGMRLGEKVMHEALAKLN